MDTVSAPIRSPSAPAWATPDRASEIPVSGMVYGVALNTLSEQVSLASAFHLPPHKAPPRAPVLYVKPPNTFAAHGATVVVPKGVDGLEVRAALAVVIGRTACRVPVEQALEHVRGYCLALDFALPGGDYYRPAVRQACRDGFLPIGPWVTPAGAIADLSAMDIVVEVEGAIRQRFSTSDLLRPVTTLIADVTDFMTLAAGDVLLAGLTPAPLTVRPGWRVSALATGLGRLDCRLAGEGDPA